MILREYLMYWQGELTSLVVDIIILHSLCLIFDVLLASLFPLLLSQGAVWSIVFHPNSFAVTDRNKALVAVGSV